MECKRGYSLGGFKIQSKCRAPCAKDRKSIANAIEGCFCTVDVGVSTSIHLRTNSFSGKGTMHLKC